ncbi:MAG: hypothetical protein SO094_01835, partial [Prevotella sp.]|nr:hypothetical protein [Prevotella sp.]
HDNSHPGHHSADSHPVHTIHSSIHKRISGRIENAAARLSPFRPRKLLFLPGVNGDNGAGGASCLEGDGWLFLWGLLFHASS